MISLTETRPATYSNGIADVAGSPTFAEVDRAMSREGERADHDLWARLNSAWDAVAWGTPCYEGVPARRQEAYEAAARELAAIRAAAAPTVEPAPTVTNPCCSADDETWCLECIHSDPAAWPEWTDADRFELGPDRDPADEAWAAEAFNADDEDLDEPEWASVESAATDSLAMGLIPADLARAINRTSLAGSADEVIHEGSDPSWCGCEPCVDLRTRRYAD